MTFSIELPEGEIFEYQTKSANAKLTHPIEIFDICVNFMGLYPYDAPYYVRMFVRNDYRITYDYSDVYIEKLKDPSPERLSDIIMMPMSEEMYNRYLLAIYCGLNTDMPLEARKLADQCLNAMLQDDFIDRFSVKDDGTYEDFVARNRVPVDEQCYETWIDGEGNDLDWLDEKVKDDPSVQKFWRLASLSG